MRVPSRPMSAHNMSEILPNDLYSYLCNVDTHSVRSILEGRWEQRKHREVNGLASCTVHCYNEAVIRVCC